MIRQAHTYLAGAVSGTALVAAAIVVFVLLVSVQAVKDWPLSGLVGRRRQRLGLARRPAAGEPRRRAAHGAARRDSRRADGAGGWPRAPAARRRSGRRAPLPGAATGEGAGRRDRRRARRRRAGVRLRARAAGPAAAPAARGDRTRAGNGLRREPARAGEAASAPASRRSGAPGPARRRAAPAAPSAASGVGHAGRRRGQRSRRARASAGRRRSTVGGAVGKTVKRSAACSAAATSRTQRRNRHNARLMAERGQAVADPIAGSPVYPLGSRLNERGHLEVGGCDVLELAAEFGTPAYVYAEDDLRARARATVAAFAERSDDFEVVYASKAFPCTAALRLFAEEGLSCDVASGGELHLALGAGFDPERIYMHGNNKTEAELELALAQRRRPRDRRLARRDRAARPGRGRPPPARPACG